MKHSNSSRDAGRGTAFGNAEPFPSAAELAADDWFLTELAAGNDDASGAGLYGTDAHLAELFVRAGHRANADVPPVPELDLDAVLGRFDIVDVEALPVDDESEPVGAASVNGVDDIDVGDGADVDDAPATGRLREVGKRGGSDGDGEARRWWYPTRVGSAMLGAAASFLLVAGGIGAIQNAGPGGVLWPVKQNLFGAHTAEVELASTLEEADAASDAGDIERAEELLARAQELMEQVNEADRAALAERMRQSEARVRTVTATATPTTVTNNRTETRVETRTRTPETVTRTPDTVTQTETATETVTETATVTATTPGTPGDGESLPFDGGVESPVVPPVAGY